ncbi:MAG TPA: peptide ABC transporter substrate-binding protein, partial [Candidatus Baltobacteraceae bacterium]|nr:peptide ABC transporter substrate-binding protein [Candidatus Baltobacteraceae bacterium]
MRVLSTMVALCIALSACSRVGPASAGKRHAWTVPRVLRIADVAEPDSLNPYLSQMDVSYAVTSLVYSYLIVADDRGQLIGDLATEVPTLANGGISRDGLTYTYHLRHGVRWQDGLPFTSADVAASWRAVVDPTHLTLFRNGYDRVASVATPDAYTFVAHLRERYPPFVTQFFAPLQEGGKPILAAHVLNALRDFNHGRLSRTAIGTGPFKLVAWKHGEGLTFVRNDDYFKGRPRLERIEYRVIPDPQTMMTELRLHQIDLIETPVGALYNVLKTFGDETLRLGPYNAQSLVAVNDARPGLRDVAVRRALSLAIDRNALIATATHGSGEPARDVVAATAVGYVARAAVPYDPRAAIALLDRNGWKLGRDGIRRKNDVALDYTIATLAGSPTFAALGVELQQYFKAIGVRLSIKPYPYNGFFAPDGPLLGGRYDLAIYGTALSWDPDAHVYYGCNQQYPRGQNAFGYCNHEFDALEARA